MAAKMRFPSVQAVIMCWLAFAVGFSVGVCWTRWGGPAVFTQPGNTPGEDPRLQYLVDEYDMACRAKEWDTARIKAMNLRDAYLKAHNESLYRKWAKILQGEEPRTMIEAHTISLKEVPEYSSKYDKCMREGDFIGAGLAASIIAQAYHRNRDTANERKWLDRWEEANDRLNR
jgi:hypothetical protein